MRLPSEMDGKTRSFTVGALPCLQSLLIGLLADKPQTGLCIEAAWMARETGHLISLLRRQLPLKGKLEDRLRPRPAPLGPTCGGRMYRNNESPKGGAGGFRFLPFAPLWTPCYPLKTTRGTCGERMYRHIRRAQHPLDPRKAYDFVGANPCVRPCWAIVPEYLPCAAPCLRSLLGGNIHGFAVNSPF